MCKYISLSNKSQGNQETGSGVSKEGGVKEVTFTEEAV